MEKLNHCPFCSGEAEVLERYGKGTPNRKMYWVECKACLAAQRTVYRSKTKAVEAWNRSAEAQRIKYTAEMSEDETD